MTPFQLQELFISETPHENDNKKFAHANFEGKWL